MKPLKTNFRVLQNKAVKTVAGQSYEYTDHDRLLKKFGRLSVRNLIKLDMGFLCTKHKLAWHQKNSVSYLCLLATFNT